MSRDRPSLLLPAGFHEAPALTAASGNHRHAGFEIEFSGLELGSAAAVVADIFGGRLRQISAFQMVVEDAPLGTFSVEVDATILKERSYLQFLEELGIGPLAQQDTQRLEDLLKRISTTVVPYEIVTPPVPIDQLDQLDRLRAALHQEGADGTGASWLYAFGLHINPEATDLGPASILAHLRAFILLYDWICTQAPIDWSRRIGPYIEPFEDDYARHVLRPEYAPDLTGLITDYLTANPSRNRALDLLPLLAHVDADAVSARVDNVNARPTYHYRLPNCRIADADWRIAHEWNGWVWIERLAASHEALRVASEARLQEGGVQIEQMESWLADL